MSVCVSTFLLNSDSDLDFARRIWGYSLGHYRGTREYWGVLGVTWAVLGDDMGGTGRYWG